MARTRQAKAVSEDRQAWAECFLLCDYARAENGKLYIVGGGWDEIVPHELPLKYKAYLGAKLVIRWDLLTPKGKVRVELMDSDRQMLGDPVDETTIEGFPGEIPNELTGFGHLYATLFMGTEVTMELTQPGQFNLRLLVNELEVATTRFRVTPPHEAAATHASM
jgi:hypothetical protein